MANGTLVSPIAGTVAAVNLVVGQSVTGSANSSSASSAGIVVLGPGSFEASTTVPVADIAKVAVGQEAIITPDTTGKPVDGTVSSIGIVGTTTTAGSTTYPVDISVGDSTGLTLISGADASIGIVIDKAENVTTVPTSAVSTIGTTKLISTYANGKVTTTRVTVGTVGDILTQVTSGVKVGDQVVLANLKTPLPTSSGSTTTGGLGGALSGTTGGAGSGAARFGGGGFGGGGFGGGGGATAVRTG